MALAWVFLFLGSWLRLLTISGLNFHHGAAFFATVPLAIVGVQTFLPGALRAPERVFLRWLLASLVALLAIAFTRLTLLRYWDPAEWLPTLLLMAVGLGLAVFSHEDGPSEQGPGPWLWVALWMLLSGRTPVLGLLGAGLAPLVFHWERLPRVKSLVQTEPHFPVWAWALPLGLFLPKPWWDWGLQPASVFPLTAFGVGGSLAVMGGLSPFQDRLRRLPNGLILGALALTGLLYAPSWGLLWGLVMGLLAGCAYGRLPKPLPIAAMAGYWILGLLLSFTLQANACLPFLGRLAWLGN